MNDLGAVEAVVKRAAARLRAERIWKGTWAGLVVGAGLWLAALAAYKAFPLPVELLGWAGWAGVLCVVGGALSGGARRVSLREAARWVDVRGNLKDRVSTAMEVKDSSLAEEWKRLVWRDTAGQVGGLKASDLLPWTLPRAWGWCVVLLALGACLGFVPEHRTASYLQRQRDLRNIQQVGKQMAQFVRRELNRQPPVLESTATAIQTAAQVGDQLSKAELTRADALKDLASAAERLKQETRELAKSPALRKMEMAARAASTRSSAQAGDLQKQMEALSKSLGDRAGKNPDAADQLRKELQKLKAQAARSLADKDAAAGDGSRQQLSQAVSELARSAESMGMPLPSLEEAIAALAANQVDQFLRDLNTAETDLEKLQAMAQTLQQLQQQAEKIGKDLAEQLKNGQAQAAQATLLKMTNVLSSGSMPPEEIARVMAEIEQAVKPAGEYGKVAEHLKAAAAKIRKGEKADATASLAEASKELDKLLGELGDAQALSSTLDALKRAQMAVGNGQMWAMSEGLPGAGRNGRPGRGVGTWADDSQYMDETDMTSGWDNSGEERADEAARGVSDRGEGSLADSLVPTRVKGQMSAGAPMPSITLKGVSIKGESGVGYRQAVMAAQTDAQSALSQDQVPRAYQGPVKDYFNDLK